MKRARTVTYRLYNFHKDNWWDIVAALFTNYTYALCTVSIPVTIFIGRLPLIVVALFLAYTMFTIVTNRPKYETLYGKMIMVLSCTLGGSTAYLIGEYIKTII